MLAVSAMAVLANTSALHVVRIIGNCHRVSGGSGEGVLDGAVVYVRRLHHAVIHGF